MAKYTYDQLLTNLKDRLKTDGAVVYTSPSSIVIDTMGEILVVTYSDKTYTLTYKEHYMFTSSYKVLMRELINFIVKFIYEV